MVNVLYASVWIFAMWKWGDWKNWQKYYPTILLFIIGDFIYLYLLSDLYPMWRYNPPEIDKQAGLTNTHIALSVMLIKYLPLHSSIYPNTRRTMQADSIFIRMDLPVYD